MLRGEDVESSKKDHIWSDSVEEEVVLAGSKPGGETKQPESGESFLQELLSSLGTSGNIWDVLSVLRPETALKCAAVELLSSRGNTLLPAEVFVWCFAL